MCRGCRIKKNGDQTVDEYLNWLDEYHHAITIMKSVEKKLLIHQSGNIDSAQHLKALDTLRKKMIRIRKDYASLADKELINI